MNNRPLPSIVTSPGDPRGVYLQQGPDVLTRTSLTGCVFHDSALLVSQLQKRGCKALTDHIRLRMRYSLRGFGRGIQHQPDHPGESASLDHSRRKESFTALQRYQLFPDQRTTAGSRASKIRQTEVPG